MASAPSLICCEHRAGRQQAGGQNSANVNPLEVASAMTISSRHPMRRGRWSPSASAKPTAGEDAQRPADQRGGRIAQVPVS